MPVIDAEGPTKRKPKKYFCFQKQKIFIYKYIIVSIF